MFSSVLSTSRRARRSGAVALLALSAWASSATIASANPAVTLQDQCTIPQIGDQPTSIEISNDFPATVPYSTPAAKWPITIHVDLGGATRQSFFDPLLDTNSLGGTAVLSTTITMANGRAIPVQVPLTFAQSGIPAADGDVTLDATGAFPPISYKPAGVATVDATAISLNLRLGRADGSFVQFPNDAGTPDGDGDPDTFDVPCAADPAAPVGSPTIASVQVLPSVPTPTPTPTPTPLPGAPIAFSDDVVGAATMPTLATGSIPLTGALDATLAPDTGAFTGNLSLNPSAASLTTLGFLSITAQLAIVPTAPVTGSLQNGVLTSNVLMRVRLLSATALGVQVLVGASCQTSKVSNIGLRSVGDSFDPLSGGTLVGTFSISNLTGCGSLAGLISPSTAGTANAIVLQLTPGVRRSSVRQLR